MANGLKTLSVYNKLSPKLSEEFYQRQSGKNNTGLMLVQSCPTRWNSEYLMVHRFLKVSEYLYEMEKDNLFGDIVTFPDNDRLARLQGYDQVLQIFHDLTELASGDN